MSHHHFSYSKWGNHQFKFTESFILQFFFTFLYHTDSSHDQWQNYKKKKKKWNLPNTACYWSRMVYPNEFIECGGDVEGRLFLIYEECVGYPYVLNKFRADWQRLYAWPLPKSQARVRPELSKVKVQGEVLTKITWLDAADDRLLEADGAISASRYRRRKRAIIFPSRVLSVGVDFTWHFSC